MSEPTPIRTRRSERVLSDWIKQEKRLERRRTFLTWLPVALFIAGMVVVILVAFS
jgi:hypothetical protein